MRNRFLAVAVALLLVPVAAADDDPEDPPCVRLDVAVAGGDLREEVPEATCDSPDVDLALEAAGTAGTGALTVRVPVGSPYHVRSPCGTSTGTSEQTPRPPCYPTVIMSASTGPDVPAFGERVVVAVRFHVAWDGARCDGARGALEVAVEDEPVASGPPPGFAERVCAVAQARPEADAVARVALGLAADVLRDLAGTAAPQAAALEATARRLATSATPPAALPTPGPDAGVGPSSAVEPQAWGESAVALPGTRPPEAHVAAGAEGAGVRADALLAVGPAPREAVAAASPQAASDDGPTVVADPRAPSRAGVLDRAPTAASPPRPGPGGRDGPAPAPVVLVPAAAARPVAPVASGAVPAAAVAFGAALVVAAVALYQRLARPAALAHPTRRALHDACVAAPGSTAGKLAEAVGVSRKNSEYHLLYLVRLGILTVRTDGAGRRRFASPTAPPRADDTLEAALVEAVRKAPGATTSELARALAVPCDRLDHRAKGLVMEGRLESRFEGRARRFFVP